MWHSHLSLLTSIRLFDMRLLISGGIPISPFSTFLLSPHFSFDIVIIDSPPIMGLADAPLLSRLVQATVLVIAANETRRSTAQVPLTYARPL